MFFGIKVSGKLMNLAPWTDFYNAVLQPPYTSNPKSWLGFYQMDLEISELSCVNFQSRSTRFVAASP